MKTFEIVIYGKVQGVWFRKHTLDKALEIGIKGWVKNLSDGTVITCAQGNDLELKRFVAWCEIGSPLSQVEKLEIKEIVKRREYKDFKILKE